MNEAIPQGYMQDGKGRLIPEAMVAPIDRTRDELVCEIVSKALAEHERLSKFKADVMAEIDAFVQLSGEQYGVNLGGNKGNITLMSFDGRYKIIRAIQERLVFDERLQVAKELIDECLRRWTEGARAEVLTLINDAFQVDAAGKVNTARILQLRRLNIQDETWERAMQAINYSLQVVGSKSYVRIYERVKDTDKYQLISLDMAGV